MYSSWEKASLLKCYAPFRPAIEAAMEKIEEYYERTAESDAHIIAMVLDPRSKLGHFKDHWGLELLEDVKQTLQDKFIERFNQLNPGEGRSAVKPVQSQPPAPSHVS
ncbi:hypothetical protein BJ165DRAFT_745549 [Panaeolus papilionaceus]|nr:hypothetical protein BJ165DRAFT_745549 [Panaeolus papilionaceus]